LKDSHPILLLLLIILLLLLIGCVCLVTGVGAYTLLLQRNTETGQGLFPPFNSPTNTPLVVRPTYQETTDTSPKATKTETPVQAASTVSDTLSRLENENIPGSDPIDLVQRFEGRTDLSLTTEGPQSPLKVGSQQSFWALNTDDDHFFEVQATLRYVTEHVYFWIEDGVSYNDQELANLVETFESKIYPTNRAFFGSEWTPGVDGDPHLYILYAKGLGGSLAGYFSPGDEYTPEVQEYSNGHEMFFLNADRAELNDDFTYGVLAHEFQHMIHWYRDRNENTWLNEGFADLAMYLNGYDIGRADYYYVSDPDIQLTDWPIDPAKSYPHYGASFMFVTYFLDRFGEEATKALITHTSNGMNSIDAVLVELGITNPSTQESINADDFFSDWVVATFIQDPDVGDGRYAYGNYPDAPVPSETESIQSCPTELITREVSQYGADYIRITCRGDHIINFEGSLQVALLPEDPYSGSYAFYSNKGDESDMTLTQTFDFSDITGTLTLNYWTWYDIEEDYDYVYLTASLDGKTWQILETPSGTIEDPTGASYGWAYNGQSGDGPNWIQESVDISRFAGHQVQLRFEYITDAAAIGEGFLLDDISIPEIGYFSDFEDDDGGWQANGFVRIQNILPQSFRLTLIRDGMETTVETIELTAENATAIPINIGEDVYEVILVVSGTTRHTRQKAAYQFIIE
jgi:hypothetical protein